MLPDALKSEEEKLADLPKGVIKDEETGQLMKDGQPWQPPPTPEMQAIERQQAIDEAQAAADMAMAEGKKATGEADIKQAEAKMADAEAKLAELRAGPVQEGPDSGQMMTEIDQIIRQAMEEHNVNENAHKAAITEAVTEAVVDALGRVKGFVDRRIKQGDQERAAGERMTVETQEPAEAPAGGGPINVAVNVGRPERINFQYDEAGNLVTAVAEEDENAGQES